MDGTVAPRFAAVRAAFGALFGSGVESGAAIAVVQDGELVVDLCGGTRADGEPWTADTLVQVFSAGKAVAAFALVMLVDRGLLRLDDPVAAHWPEFAAAGKGDVTVRHVLAHAAGLPAFPDDVPAHAAGDWDRLCAVLAAADPHWTAGEAVGEHALTYGHLVGEVVRRVDGRPLGRFLREEVAKPWGLDLALGEVDPSGEFGMGGVGGCDAVAFPDRNLAYAYVTRRLADHDRSERVLAALP